MDEDPPVKEELPSDDKSVKSDSKDTDDTADVRYDKIQYLQN